MENQNEKLLIYYDEKASLQYITAMKKLTKAALDLKETFDFLQLGTFSKEILLGLISSGTSSLVEEAKTSFESQIEGQAVRVIFGQLSEQVDFRVLLEPLKDPLFKLKMILIQTKIDPSEVEFIENIPAFNLDHEEKIKERFRYYATGLGEQKFFKLVLNFCDAANAVEKCIQNQKYPSLLNGLIITTGRSYFDFDESKDVIKLVPNPTMFLEIEAIKKYQKKG